MPQISHFEKLSFCSGGNLEEPKTIIILSSYVEGHVKKNRVWISCLQLVSKPPKSGCFFGKNFVELVQQSFSSRNNSQKPPVFDFLTAFHNFWKNQESCESWLVGFWVNRHSKMQNIFANNFFFFCIFELALWIY